MEEALNQIAIIHDLFSEIFLVSTVLSFCLGIIVLYKGRLKNQIFNLLGFLLFILAALIADLYLARSGLMKYCLWYNDLTEWMVITLGPCLFLICKSLLSKSKLLRNEMNVHFLAPFLYACYQLFDIIQPVGHKFNAYVGAFRPEVDFVHVQYTTLVDPLCLKEHFEKIILLSIIGYAVAGILMMIRHENFPDWQNVRSNFNKYTFVYWSFISLIANGLSLLFLFVLTEENTSHSYIGLLISFEVFMLFALITSGSNIFTSAWVSDKYDTSGLSKANSLKVLRSINQLFADQKSYLNPKISLSSIAETLNIPPNHVSQAINLNQGQNFNEYINHFRIQDSISMLRSEEFDALTIEGIGRKVGFSSKSAFYAAFKKVTNSTPVAFKSDR